LCADTAAGANASANLYSHIETAKDQQRRASPVSRHVVQEVALPLAQTLDDYEALPPWNIGLV
jgi:hypothetical protein